PISYAALFVVLTSVMGVPLVSAAALLVVTLLLGLFTLQYAQRARSLGERGRLMLARWSHPRLVRRARAEQRGLLRLL
ncbi:hypothetical protein NL329_31090, partial [Klebsiella pneumoniae]|nr:hypothetical protein [Klebsiella pneumoniae]